MKKHPIDQILDRIDVHVLIGTAVALAAIVVLGGALYGVKPSMAAYADLKSQHEAVRAGPMAEDLALSRSVVELENTITKLRDEFYGGGASVPRRQLEAFIVNALDRSATEHEVDLLGITPAPAAAIWMFDELPYQVKVQGEYFAIHRWLFDLEDALRPMVIKQFKMAPNRDGEKVVVDLRIVAYRPSEGAQS